ncbi:MAG TPA: hypothetical protein VGQ26_28070 [Streptosporangiaceae bacterium]|nr:hypothetical protein [Streptosporangiaceae bacterium]
MRPGSGGHPLPGAPGLAGKFALGPWGAGLLAWPGLDVSGLDVLPLDVPELDGAVLAWPGPDVVALDGAALAWPGLDVLGLGVLGLGVVGLGLEVSGPGLGVLELGAGGAGLVGFGVVGFGLLAGLPQSVGPALAPLALAPLAVPWLGLVARLAPVRLGFADGLVRDGLGLADGLVPDGLGIAAGPVPVAPGLGGGAANPGVCDAQLAGGCPGFAVPWPLPTAPVMPEVPLPEPPAADPSDPADPPPPIELMSEAASANICRPNGVSAETLNARTNVTAATAATRRARPDGVPGRAAPPLSRVRPGGPGTGRRHPVRSDAVTEASSAEAADSPIRARLATSARAATIQATSGCSQAQTADSPIRARLAASEGAAITQAKGAGRGVVSRAWIRSRPSPETSIESTAECSARRRTSSWSRWCWLIPNVPARRATPKWPGRYGS